VHFPNYKFRDWFQICINYFLNVPFLIDLFFTTLNILSFWLCKLCYGHSDLNVTFSILERN